MQSFIPENQWPKQPASRQKLALHLTHEMIPAVDIRELLNMFAVGMTFTHNNGILRSKNNVMFAASLVASENDMFENADTCVVYASQLIGLAFHAVFCAFKHDIRQIPCMLYQCTLHHRDPTSSKSIFYNALYAQVMPLLSVPPSIATALQIGRPDLQIVVMEIYMIWLKRVKRPELVEEAIITLLKSTWEFDTTTFTYSCLKKWVDDCDIQIAVIGSKCPKTEDLDDLNFSRLLNANIAIDGHSLLVASKRDRILLAMLFLFESQCGWAVKGLPSAQTEFPSVFSTLQLMQPYLFDCSQSVPTCLFDELSYLQL